MGNTMSTPSWLWVHDIIAPRVMNIQRYLELIDWESSTRMTWLNHIA